MKNYCVSTHIRIFLDNETGNFHIKEATENKSLLLESSDSKIIQFLHEVKEVCTKEVILQNLQNYFDHNATDQIFNDLIKYKILVPQGETETNNMWEFYDMEDFNYFLEITSHDKYVDVSKENTMSEIVTSKDTLRSYWQEEDRSQSFLLKEYISDEVISLPKPSPITSDFFTAIFKRRTVRKFNDEPTTFEQLSAILYFGFSDLRQIKNTVEADLTRDISVLTESFLISHEAYIVVFNVVNLKRGIYGYNITANTLSFIKDCSENDIAKIITGQSFSEGSAFAIFLTSVYERLLWRYRSAHQYKKILIGAAELAQQIINVATMLNLGVFQTPAIIDSHAVSLLNTDELNEEAVYYLAIGNFGN